MLGKILSWLTCKIYLKKLEGIENLPKGGYIVAANHESYFDIWAMEMAFLLNTKKWIKFIASKSLVNDPYFKYVGLLFKHDSNIPILIERENPDTHFFEAALQSLKKNYIIGIYPEGSRSPNGKIQKGKTGAVRLALYTKSPIVPVGLKGTYEIMPKGSSIPKISKSIIMRIGKPIDYKAYYDTKDDKVLVRKLTDELMSEIAQLSNQKYQP